MNFRELCTDDYLKEQTSFFNKYNEYLKKLAAINKAENLMFDNGTITDDIEKENECRRDELKKEYEGYNDYYCTDFFCWMTYENIDKLIEGNNNKYFREDLKLVGEKVQTDTDIYGILIGIAVMVDDVYFVIDDECTDRYQWVSAVGGIKPFEGDNIKDHKYHVVSNDKGYL